MASTIEIKSGVPESCTRMVLKREMERFGQVDVCHMGNRQDPTNEPPWVRFANAKSADSALTAIQAGEVFIDGIVIAADRSNKRGPPLVSREPRDAEIGSRELFLKGGAAGGKGKGKGGKGDRRGSSRDRYPPRGRDHSRKRSRSRSRSRRRRRDRRRRSSSSSSG
mmetsp:Transcript_51594/g.122771  ORF Transcript_51594/g.122771 Transcript_51594/m.122771 type:complete len:166 (-) Transcript_51594:125-622(-)